MHHRHLSIQFPSLSSHSRRCARQHRCFPSPLSCNYSSFPGWKIFSETVRLICSLLHYLPIDIQEARVPLQIWVTQKGNGLMNEEIRPDGVLGIIPMLFLSLHKKLHIFFAVLSLTAGSTGVEIADVTVDACVAQNSNTHKHLAPDMQSLSSLSSSTGSLLGFFLNGILVHLIGPKGVYGLLTIPPAFVFLVGTVLDEPTIPNASYKQVGSLLVTHPFSRFCPMVHPYQQSISESGEEKIP